MGAFSRFYLDENNHIQYSTPGPEASGMLQTHQWSVENARTVKIHLINNQLILVGRRYASDSETGPYKVSIQNYLMCSLLDNDS